MAKSKCVSCGNTSFELIENDGVKGSTIKFRFIQCSKCGGVVGALDHYEVGYVAQTLYNKITGQTSNIFK